MADKIIWKKGFRVGGLPDADVAARELDKIRKENDGTLSSSRIVDASRGKRKLFHNYFEWDDSVAGHEHRLTQARALLRAVAVVKDDLPDRPVRKYEISQAYSPGERKYETMEEMLADPEKREILLQRALNELLAVRRKYHRIQELAIVFREVENLRTTVLR